jgi:hypothetical protein
MPVLALPGNVVAAAQELVRLWINDQIGEHVTARLLYDLPEGGIVLRFVPKNLLGALWLQFALALDGNSEQRPCKECGKFMKIGGGSDARTARRQFCSDACKTRHYRRKRKQVQQPKTEGRTGTSPSSGKKSRGRGTR